jgi:hypothetical protein
MKVVQKVPDWAGAKGVCEYCASELEAEAGDVALLFTRGYICDNALLDKDEKSIIEIINRSKQVSKSDKIDLLRKTFLLHTWKVECPACKHFAYLHHKYICFPVFCNEVIESLTYEKI